MTTKADRIRNRRQAFATPGSSLDKIVRVLALGLPALVGMIAAMMLITPLSPRGEVSFLLDRNKVAVAEDRLRVNNAMYRGEDQKGRPFSLMAGSAVQESNSLPLVQLQDLTARIVLPDGPAVLTAPGARYDIDDEVMSIPGIVRFTAADGYEMSARNVAIDLADQVMTGSGRVSGVVPAGNFSADRVRADLATRTLLLSGNAHMRMVPGKLRLPSAVR
tara:strand:- start:9715 stop:10371 length:657 start_codon:yes stop_codon:yes gene_type:complete